MPGHAQDGNARSIRYPLTTTHRDIRRTVISRVWASRRCRSSLVRRLHASQRCEFVCSTAAGERARSDSFSAPARSVRLKADHPGGDRELVECRLDQALQGTLAISPKAGSHHPPGAATISGGSHHLRGWWSHRSGLRGRGFRGRVLRRASRLLSQRSERPMAPGPRQPGRRSASSLALSCGTWPRWGSSLMAGIRRATPAEGTGPGRRPDHRADRAARPCAPRPVHRGVRERRRRRT